MNKIQRPFHSKRPSKSFNLPNILQDHTAFQAMKPFETSIKRLVKQRNENNNHFNTNNISYSPNVMIQNNIVLGKTDYLNADLSGFPRIKKKAN